MEDGEIQEENGRRIDGKARDATQAVDVLRRDDTQQEENEVAGEEMDGEQVAVDAD